MAEYRKRDQLLASILETLSEVVTYTAEADCSQISNCHFNSLSAETLQMRMSVIVHSSPLSGLYPPIFELITGINKPSTI